MGGDGQSERSRNRGRRGWNLLCTPLFRESQRSLAWVRGLIYRIICGQWRRQAIYRTSSLSYCGVDRTSFTFTTANKFGEGSSQINSIYYYKDQKKRFVQ